MQVLYLLKLCAYENEQTLHFIGKDNRKNFAIFAKQESMLSLQPRKPKGGIWSSDLIDSNLQRQSRERGGSEELRCKLEGVDVECEVNGLHGLRHLNASDEELSDLFRN